MDQNLQASDKSYVKFAGQLEWNHNEVYNL